MLTISVTSMYPSSESSVQTNTKKPEQNINKEKNRKGKERGWGGKRIEKYEKGKEMVIRKKNNDTVFEQGLRK